MSEPESTENTPEPPPAKKPGPPHLTGEDWERILHMQRRGYTQAEIAKALGRDRGTINKALARYNRRLIARLETRSATVKVKQIDQLEALASDLLRAFETDVETIKVTEERDAQGQWQETKREVTTRPRYGDPAIAHQVRGALADVRKILGLDAPPPKPKEESDGDFTMDLSEGNTDDTEVASVQHHDQPQSQDDPPQQADGPPA